MGAKSAAVCESVVKELPPDPDGQVKTKRCELNSFGVATYELPPGKQINRIARKGHQCKPETRLANGEFHTVAWDWDTRGKGRLPMQWNNPFHLYGPLFVNIVKFSAKYPEPVEYDGSKKYCELYLEVDTAFAEILR